MEFLRTEREEIISHVLSGNNALVLMPTGGGKSLCYYRLPALAFGGLTIVVSPLIALMKDQVDALRADGIPLAFINSPLPASAIADIQRELQAGQIKLLYVAPERLSMPEFQTFLQSLDVSLLAIDEAHYTARMGSRFSSRLPRARLRELLQGVPLIALTAAANDRVRRKTLSVIST